MSNYAPDFNNKEHREAITRNLANSGNGVIEDACEMIEAMESQLANLTRERDAMQATVEKCRAAGEWREAKHTDTFSHGDLILAAVKIHPLGQQPHWEIGLVRFDSSDNRMRLREMSGNEWRWYWDDVRFWMPVKTPSAAERAKGGGDA